MTLTDDLAAVLADAKGIGLAVSVVHGANTVDGIHDRGPSTMIGTSGLEIQIDGESVQVATHLLGVAGGLNPAPVPNDALTSGGNSYRVRELRPEGPDGKMTRLILVPQT